MSLSNVQPFVDNYRRDSFGDRVCDDLSEVILQCLPIKDKFRFECVSKQFQRTLLQRHYDLIIPQNYYLRRRNPQTFEFILKKLPNIQSIKGYNNFLRLNDTEIELIIKCCNHLTHFCIPLSGISKTFKQLFIDKFGSKLISLYLDSSYKPFISRLTHIQEITETNGYFNSSNQSIKFYTKFKPKSLKKVVISLLITDLVKFLENDIKYFNTFIENNKSITNLSLKFIPTIGFQLIDLNIGVISQLSQLISLQIISYSEFIEFKLFINYLKLFSVKCSKLKSLRLELHHIPNKVLTNNDFMSVIKNFLKLKRFEFKYFGESVEELEEYFVNSLKTRFQNLTHLTIDLIHGYNFDSEMSETLSELLLQNISIYLPNLQNLIIKSRILIKESTADILSRLSKLEVLELNIKTKGNQNKDFKVSFEKKIFKNCRKIRSIRLQTPIILSIN